MAFRALRRSGTRYGRPLCRASLRVGALVLLVAFGVGCSTWRGARHYQAGTEALDAGAYPAAVDRLEQARELVPHRSEVRNHLALAYLAQDRRADALRELRSAIELDCGNDAARWNLRALEADLGIEPDEAWPPPHRAVP